MVNFILDPTGELPWDEDVLARSVRHLNNEKVKDALSKQPMHVNR